MTRTRHSKTHVRIARNRLTTLSLTSGSELRGYRVERLLGRGGMGDVYLAEDLRLRRRVALKVLAPSLAADVKFRNRFLAESKLAASLDHPCVVPIYEAGEVDGQLFIAMRFVEGSDLKVLLRGGRLTTERTVAVCAQVADALDFAHERGLVHRDVKPANVLFDGRDHVYLADFGVTKRLEESHTAEPRLIGTIGYIAPEQIRGEAVDGRADEYSLGCVLYECLTGERPFARDHDAAVLFAHLQEQPPVLPGLEVVLQTALAKDPGDRYPTCVDLMVAAAEALGLGERARLRGLPFGLSVPVCPFKGLASFDRADAEYFCGRERVVSEVVARLATSTLVGILGPSGIGKSSVLRAGVLPALTAGALPGSAGAQQVMLRPGEHPHAELTRVLGGEELDAAVARLAPGERIVVAIDQLEELFTMCRQEQERAAFLAQLAAAAHDHERRALVLASLRADFYGRVAPYPAFAQLLSSSHVLIGPMDREELARAIEEPASRAGLEVDQPLVDALVSDVAGQPGGLPLLSTMLLELWRARDERRLRFESYRTSGGVRGAVARLAERVFVELGERERGMVRGMMLRLVSGEDDALVRRRVPLSELVQFDGAERVLAMLTDARLLTVTDGDVEVSHEALLWEWPRCKAWLEEDRVGRRLHAHLATTAREWDRGARDPSELYRGVRLAGALEWAARHGDQVNTIEREFLDASRLETERQERRKRAQNRRLRGLLMGIGALLVVSVVAGVIAVVQRQNAKRQATTATSLLLASDAQANLGNRLDVALQLSLAALEPPYRAGALASAEARSSMIAALETIRGSGLSAILRGHATPVNSVAFSSDGHRLLSASDNGKVSLWDLATHKQLGSPLAASAGSVLGGAFSPNGRTLAFVNVDGTVGLWDLATHKQLDSPPTAGTGRVKGLAFSADGRVLATTGGDGRVWLWDLATREQLGSPLSLGIGPDVLHVALAFSPDGRELASASGDGRVWLWDLATREQLGSLTEGTSPVLGLAFSSDGRELASASGDGAVRLWDLATDRQLGSPLTVGNGSVLGVAFSRDGRTLASASVDGTVSLWDLPSAKHFGSPLSANTSPVNSVAFDPDGRTLASASNDGTVRLWNLATGKQLGSSLSADTSPVNSVAFSRDGRTLASASGDGRVSLWDLATHRQRGSPLRANTSPVYSVAFGRDGRTLASASGDGSVRLWDLSTREQLGSPLRASSSRVLGVAVAPDGRTLASASGDGRVRLWDLATHKQLGSPLTASTQPVFSVAFGRDGRTLASANYDGTVRLWDLATRKQLGSPLGANTSPVLGVAFGPDGRTLASASGDGTVSLWDLITHKQLGSALGANTNPVNSVAFSPDGRTLASGDLDGAVRLWSGFLWRDFGELRNEVCRVVGSGLDPTEWARYASGVRYRHTCP